MVAALAKGLVVQQEVEFQVKDGSTERVVTLEDTEQLASLLSLSYEPMLAWHLNAAIKYWNAGAERLYGFAPDEAIGRISHSLLQTKFPIEFNAIHSELRSKGYWSGELRHVCKDGREVVVDSRMQLHGDDIVLEVNRDITEQKQSEEAVRQSEAGLARELADAKLLHSVSVEMVLEQSIDALYKKIIEAAVIVMRSHCASMQMFHHDNGSGGELRLLAHLGFSPHAVSFWQRIGIDSQSACSAAVRTRRRVILPDVEQCDDLAGTDDLAVYRETGIRAVQTTPLFSRNGVLVGVISTHWREPHQPSERDLRQLDILARQAADLIERSQAEAALRDSEERARQLAAIVESNNDSIVATDLERTITTWNRAAERLYGYTAAEAVGTPIAACTIPEDRRHEEITIFERIRGGEPVEPFDTVRRRKDGSLIEVSLSVSPVRDLNGQIVGASAISRDITERKRADERIAMLAREAEHRTRNVLATVQTLVHLSQADTPEGLRTAIEGRLQALSNAHALFIQSRWLGADILTLARQELAPYLEKQGPRIRIYGPHIPIKPKMAQALAIILHELTTNAAKYGGLSARQGQVELNWVAVSDHLLLLTWSETGGPVVATPSRRGFGTQVMETLIKVDLAGELRFDWRAEGLVCEIEFQI